MDIKTILTKKNILISATVICLAIFTLWLRILPMLTMGNTDILSMVGSDDPLYNLRQVEQILSNFPNYAWFDPMTQFPNGEQIYWGSLFPVIIATGCKIFGAVSRPEIIGVGLLVPPIMAAVMVGVMYYVGKTCGDWKTGLLSAGFSAVVSGQYFYRSMYGYMDHHMAEVLFSTVFCLLYMYVLMSEMDNKIDLKNVRTYSRLIFLSALAGVAYCLGLFVMPTMVLFAMIVGIFTAVQFILNVMRGKRSEYLLLINIITFSVAIIGTLLYGFNSNSIDLSRYSPGQVIADIIVIVGTVFLYVTAKWVIDSKKEWYHYVGILVGTVVAVAFILMVISPQLYNVFITSFIGFFGQQAVTETVQEARAWSMTSAWLAFSYGLILMVIGLIISAYNNLIEEKPQYMFAIIWSAIILLSTWQHIRYEYYLAINVALLSAVCISSILNYSIADFKKLYDLITDKENVVIEDIQKPKNKKRVKKAINHNHPNYGIIGVVIIFVVFTSIFAYTSLNSSYSASLGIRMNGDWKESLEWMANSTPDEGIDYLKFYDSNTFKYPNQSYGVMSWWDYGHMITYIAKRTPNANPFQNGIVGNTGSSTFFMSTDEPTANAVMDAAKTRYIMTDIEMDTGKFWAMATWLNPSLSTSPYMGYFLVSLPNDPINYQPILLNTDGYYLTMVSRLHNFDGTLTDPSLVYYVEFTEPYVSGSQLPTILRAQEMNYVDAIVAVKTYNSKTQKDGYHATILSQKPDTPTTTIPALQHYRLVHESPTNAVNGADIKYVKTFEYVKGAHIKGNGSISISVLTNTGRTFIYKQNSINGEFIVPYSTYGNPYDVKTIGKYKLVGDDTEYDVSETDIIGG